MLAAIGITLILKEIPHLIGYDQDFFGDESFWQFDGHNTFSELFYALNAFEMGAIVIGIGAICILLFFDSKWVKNKSLSTYVPGALVVVVFGVVVNQFFLGAASVNGKHLVVVPQLGTITQLKQIFHHPDWSLFSQPKIWVTAFTLALVGSLETLLSVEATDKLDPKKGKTNPHLELKAQGIGNLVSGLIGGLPITQVIVRSSANISAGGQSKLAAFIHGVFLIVAVLFLSGLLNLIPLAALAAVLILVGYKLAKWSLFIEMYRKGLSQFIPFMTTIIAILFTDLLKGIAVGILVSVFYILKRNYQNHFSKVETEDQLELILSEEVTFLNKGDIMNVLYKQKDKRIVIDASRTKSIDQDVLEALQEFKFNAEQEGRQQIIFINL